MSNNGPWNFIGWYIIWGEIGRVIRRHWKLILLVYAIYMYYRHFVWGHTF